MVILGSQIQGSEKCEGANRGKKAKAAKKFGIRLTNKQNEKVTDLSKNVSSRH